MGMWETRVTAYRLALCMSYLVFLLYGLAFAIPMWLGKGNSIIGLWAFGTGDSDEIDSIEGTGFTEGRIDRDWFDAVRGLWAGGMALYLFSVIGSMVENCCLSAYATDYGVSAVLLLLSGLSGGAGIILTAVSIEDDNYAGYSSTTELDYMWGYMIAVIASGLAILCAIVLLITKNSFKPQDDVKNSRTADYVYAHKHNHNQQQRGYAPEYNNPAYRGGDEANTNGYPPHQQGPQTVLQNHTHTPYSQSPYSMYRSSSDNNNGGNQGQGYYPYGYKDQQSSRHHQQPGNRVSMAESADLSNGYTMDIVNAEYSSLGRRGDYVGGPSQQQQRGGGGPQHLNGGDYVAGMQRNTHQQQPPNAEFFYNGSSRPY